MGLGDIVGSVASRVINSSPAENFSDAGEGISEGFGKVKSAAVAPILPAVNAVKAGYDQSVDLAENPGELPGQAFNSSPSQWFNALPQTQSIHAALNPMQFGQ